MTKKQQRTFDLCTILYQARKSRVKAENLDKYVWKKRAEGNILSLWPLPTDEEIDQARQMVEKGWRPENPDEVEKKPLLKEAS